MIDSYLLDDVVITTKSGAYAWGEKPTATVTVKARVEFGNKIVRNFAGEEVTSSAVIMMKDRAITPEDKITIDGRLCAILSYKRYRAFGSYQILEVAVG